jgi:anion-transporting  ArsA/GET3 family ATPase
MNTSPVDKMLSDHKTIVCCGTGGVGKTTIAATLGIRAAGLNKKVCVITIDPAKRLAQALGLDNLSNEPQVITGDWPGELHAMMLDSKKTFDDLIYRYAPDSSRAENILNNRLYKSLSGSLGGTQEYMASEKLYELSSSQNYDLVIVDTPPARNALDFIESPQRLTRFLENKIFRFLLLPTKAYLRAVGFATQALIRTISKVAGGELVADAIEFFRDFEGMEEGFRKRAKMVDLLLRSDTTAFILVTSPKRQSVKEAQFFIDKLNELAIGINAVIVNKVMPDFGLDKKELNTKNLSTFAELFKHESSIIKTIAEITGNKEIFIVPIKETDIHDLAGLIALSFERL